MERLLAAMKATLGDRVSGVTVSKRLVESPATLVNPDHMPGNLQKVMQMIDREFKATPKTLEINPGHPLLRNMARLAAAQDAGEQALLKDLTEQLLDNCLLVEGQIEHPERMIGRIHAFMTQASQAAVRPGAPSSQSPGAPSGAPPADSSPPDDAPAGGEAAGGETAGGERKPN